jgi:maltose alpha-D-glucosyltransferase/alpha-amylase
VENRADLWQITVDELSLYLERVSAGHGAAEEVVENYLELCRLLGRRTAQMHLGIATAGQEYAELAPEPFDPFSLRGASYSMTSLAELVRQTISFVRPDSGIEEDVPQAVRERLGEVKHVFAWLTRLSDVGSKMRTHGDYHLGQVLYTGEDLVIIDFEGDSCRPLSERLIKTSPLADVASMLYSMRYAATSLAFRDVAGAFVWNARSARLREHTSAWYQKAAATFTGEYRSLVSDSPLVPASSDGFKSILDVYLAAKAVYQLAYELKHRPEWVPVASQSLLDVTEDAVASN